MEFKVNENSWQQINQAYQLWEIFIVHVCADTFPSEERLDSCFDNWFASNNETTKQLPAFWHIETQIKKQLSPVA